MANLSNVSPWTAGLQGAMGGIENAYKIQQLKQQQQEAPLRMQALQTQAGLGELKLKQAQQEMAAFNQPWKDAFLGSIEDEQSRNQMAKRIEKFTDDGTGRQMLQTALTFDTQMFDITAKNKLRNLNERLIQAQQMGDTNQVNALMNQIDIAQGKYDVIKNKVATNEVLKNNPEITKNSAFQFAADLAKQTGDMGLLQKVVTELAKDPKIPLDDQYVALKVKEITDAGRKPTTEEMISIIKEAKSLGKGEKSWKPTDADKLYQSYLQDMKDRFPGQKPWPRERFFRWYEQKKAEDRARANWGAIMQITPKKTTEQPSNQPKQAMSTRGNQIANTPPTGYVIDPQGRTVGGKPVYISPDGEKAWW